MSNQEELLADLLGEGVQTMIEEGWVDPDDFEDPELQTALHFAVNAYDNYHNDLEEAIRVAGVVYRRSIGMD